MDFVTTTPRVPGPGETLTATSLEVNGGGKGANSCVACGKASWASENNQDVTVEMIGAVGKGDPYYDSLLKPTLENSGVSTRGVREIEGTQTGTATILVEENGENRILVVPGANHDAMQDADILYEIATQNTQPAVLVMQGEIPRATTFDLLKRFSKSQTQIIFNPAPVFPEGIPKDIMETVDFLVVNESECLLLAKSLPDSSAEEYKEGTMPEDDLQNASSQFHKQAGITNIVITLGAKGVFYSSEATSGTISGVKVDKVVDTTAAGDTFVGYFAVALARHIGQSKSSVDFDTRAAISRANVAAARCVQSSGAMQSIPFNYDV